MDATLDLAALHASHLHTQRARFDRALSACGYSGVLVYSGPLMPIFRDDQTQPFRVHAWFKAWVPLIDVPDCFLYYEPGRTPVLLFHQPSDYWYKAAEPPQASGQRKSR